ncbi:YbaB/EbfC family nucleoid-associated protein, partial [Lentzea sp. NPDC060358]|uniref:YbaB/EbfC family nucleoid-associated protein n=1 Tax=Lentzea sp. NPDC060358 TaxID=3347103 RepID=UPI003647C8D7
MTSANPYQWVEEYEAKLADLKQKSENLTENFAAASATVTSKDGAVTVTVGPNGGLQNLQLGHRALELGGPRLTAVILETARKAQKQAAEQVLELFKPLGEGTEAYQMVSDSIPSDDDETEE